MADVRLVEVESESLDRMRAALCEAGLPLEDLQRATHLYALRETDETLGWAALEVHETSALLRSVVVPETCRRSGVGSKLVREVLQAARDAGVEQVWLLSETAVSFFEKLGFSRTERINAPRSIQATSEFLTVCPASAVCMARDL